MSENRHQQAVSDRKFGVFAPICESTEKTIADKDGFQNAHQSCRSVKFLSSQAKQKGTNNIRYATHFVDAEKSTSRICDQRQQSSVVAKSNFGPKAQEV